ncbi:MAG: hypothetical protein IPG34_11250 [Rhodocyclaceae bacterium]|nr:hypothetical protein [Rhodocyclaceae bacterium]
MWARLRHAYWQLGGSAAQLFVIIIAAQFESATGWRIAMVLVALLSLLSWVLAMRHVRAVADTPTSKVASAAQGYVELIGIGRPFDGPPVLAKLSMSPCLWFRYLVERRSDNKWKTESKGESDASFLLDDGSAICVVDPEGAQILTRKRHSWTEGSYRYTEWRIDEGDEVYALGHFVTQGGADLSLDVNEDVKLLLAEWKKDPARLNQRFDLDRNGELDMREWELARAQAKREVLAVHREARLQSDTHLMRLPPDARLYLVATITPESIVRRYRLWASFHVACFFAALGALWYLWDMV